MPHPSTTDVFTNPLIDSAEVGAQISVSDRRALDRRGTRIQVMRFSGDRRRGDERRHRNRRGFDRHPIEIEASLRQAGQSAGARTVDLSVLGASLADGPLLPIGALVRVTFILPDDLEEFPLLTWAQVVSHDEGGLVGYRFVGLRPCDARRIGRLLNPRGGSFGAGGGTGVRAGGHRF